MRNKFDGKLISNKNLNTMKIGFVVLYCKRRLIFAERTKQRYFEEYNNALKYANKVKHKKNIKMVLIWDCVKRRNEHIYRKS